jgi:hypothetical protein
MLRQAEFNGIITKEEYHILTAMLDDQPKAARNHANAADTQLMDRIGDYFELMAAITEKIAIELGLPEAQGALS